jgi:hypothetical protein
MSDVYDRLIRLELAYKRRMRRVCDELSVARQKRSNIALLQLQKKHVNTRLNRVQRAIAHDSTSYIDLLALESEYTQDDAACPPLHNTTTP